MKVIYKNETLNVIDLYYVTLPALTIGKRSYKHNYYVAVRTEKGTFEVNGKSKVFNIHNNNNVMDINYINKICMFSKKLKVIFETDLERNFFNSMINYKD